VFPILVAAPQYIAGAMSLGVLMQAAQAFQRLTSALSWPIDNLGDMARTRASADRVLSLYEDMQRLDAEARTPDGNRIVIERDPHARLLIRDLCIADPEGRILLERLDTEIRRGERVLIAGDPAVTSSLFKVIGGLWPWGSGRVLLPAEGSMQFMPQRPFLPEGTLRRALCYPRPADAFGNDAVLRALECSGCAWLAPRLTSATLGAVTAARSAASGLRARALLRPAWILLEEATDAFDRAAAHHPGMLQHELPNTPCDDQPPQRPGALHHRKIVLNRLTEALPVRGKRENGSSLTESPPAASRAPPRRETHAACLGAIAPENQPR
jgi:putative ATP-binding cassette transporter